MVDIVRGVATENAIKPVEEELRRDVAHVTTQHQPMEEVIVLKLPSKQKLATINIVLVSEIYFRPVQSQDCIDRSVTDSIL